jgi:hypothetical protein
MKIKLKVETEGWGGEPVAQVLHHLPSKHEALSSNPNTAPSKKMLEIACYLTQTGQNDTFERQLVRIKNLDAVDGLSGFKSQIFHILAM